MTRATVAAEPVSIFGDEKRAPEILARITSAGAAFVRALAEGEEAEAARVASARAARAAMATK